MRKMLNVTVKLSGTALIMALLAACASGGSERQIAEARAVHAFDESRLPYGQRYVIAKAMYKPRVYGLNPYFGR